MAAILSLPLAWMLRREAAWMNAVAAAAVVILGLAAQQSGGDGVFAYLWAALCAGGLAAWGVFERRPERINLGIAGFAVTVLEMKVRRSESRPLIESSQLLQGSR